MLTMKRGRGSSFSFVTRHEKRQLSIIMDVIYYGRGISLLEYTSLNFPHLDNIAMNSEWQSDVWIMPMGKCGRQKNLDAKSK